MEDACSDTSVSDTKCQLEVRNKIQSVEDGLDELRVLVSSLAQGVECIRAGAFFTTVTEYVDKCSSQVRDSFGALIRQVDQAWQQRHQRLAEEVRKCQTDSTHHHIPEPAALCTQSSPVDVDREDEKWDSLGFPYVGAPVRIAGLAKAKVHNDKLGRVTSIDSAGRRVGVRLDRSTCISVKLSNVQFPPACPRCKAGLSTDECFSCGFGSGETSMPDQCKVMTDY